jgi:uncharacterized RDD family membrane protein YckC
METTQEHLFADQEYQNVQASKGKRFANYLIDLVGFYILVFIAGMVMALLSPSIVEVLNEEGSDFDIMANLVSLLIFLLYMFGMEALFNGKTLGKMMTGTRAVNEDGSNITFTTAILRGLCRLVPFEPFSALGFNLVFKGNKKTHQQW